MLKKDKQVSPTFIADLAKALGMGQQCVFSSYRNQTHLFADMPDREKWALLRLGKGSQAARKAVYASFYFGVMSRLYQKGVPRVLAGIWGTMRQQELMKALLWLPPEARSQFFSAYEYLGVHPSAWKSMYTGALAAAQVARIFLQLTSHVYQPHIYEDMVGKIDLIVYFSKYKRGLAIQIKGDSTRNETTYEVITEDWARNVQESSYLIQFLKGTEIFQEGRTGKWNPVRIHVGLQDVPPEQVENCIAVQNAIAQMLSDKTLGLVSAEVG